MGPGGAVAGAGSSRLRRARLDVGDLGEQELELDVEIVVAVAGVSQPIEIRVGGNDTELRGAPNGRQRTPGGCGLGGRCLSSSPRELGIGHIGAELGEEHELRVRCVTVLHQIRLELILRRHAQHDGAPDLLEREPFRRRRRGRSLARRLCGRVLVDENLQRVDEVGDRRLVDAELLEQRAVLRHRAGALPHEPLVSSEIDPVFLGGRVGVRFLFRRGIGIALPVDGRGDE
jgi:hypothetical protein